MERVAVVRQQGRGESEGAEEGGAMVGFRDAFAI